MGPLLLTTLAPVLFLFAGNILFAVHPLGYLQDHWRDLPRIVAAGFVIASYFALLGLAISSLTSRRAFAMGGAVACCSPRARPAPCCPASAPPTTCWWWRCRVIPVILAQRMFPDVEDGAPLATAGWLTAYLVVCGLSLLVLLLRYRRADG